MNNSKEGLTETVEDEGSRGGCLDAFVTMITCGYFGVETKYHQGLPNSYPDRIFKGNPPGRSMDVGEFIYDRSVSKTKHIDMKVIRTK